MGLVPSLSFISSSSLRLIVVVLSRSPSSSHHLILRIFTACAVSSCSSLFVVVSLLVLFIVPSSRRLIHFIRHLIPAVVLSVVVLPHRAPFRLLVARCSAPRLVHRSVVVPPLVPLSSRSIPSARSRSPFHRQGRAGRFSHSIARRAGQASRGRGGAWDSDGRGVHAIGEGHGQASRRGGGG